MTVSNISVIEIEKWVKNAQAGQDECFSKIYDYFFNKIFRYVSFRVSQEEVEDIVGDIFFKTVKNLTKYKYQNNIGFSAWIFQIAHNIIVDFYRKQKKLLGIEKDDFFWESLEDEVNQKPDIEIDNILSTEKIYEFLAELSSQSREVLELRFVVGLSSYEIAKVIDKSEGNVRIIQMRALREMKKKFEKYQNLKKN